MPEITREKTKSSVHPVWCAQHDCHPEECWEIHNPAHAVFAGRIPVTPEDEVRRIADLHTKYQKEGRPDEGNTERAGDAQHGGGTSTNKDAG